MRGLRVWTGAGAASFLTLGTPASFIFSTLGGEIYSWRGGVPANNGVLQLSRKDAGAVYTGLAPATVGGAPRLYAADLRNNRNSGARNHLYFTAGPMGETEGVMGRIMPNPLDVGATVPATLSLTLGPAPSLGTFVPGVAAEYTATSTATVISTAGDATLSVSDPGRLTNGTFTLPQPLQVSFSKSSWSAPVSNEDVTITFKQPIGAGDAQRTGTYSKTLTFTLSTTNP